MSPTVQDPWHLCIPDPPPSFLADESAFPVGTVITGQNGGHWKCTFTKIYVDLWNTEISFDTVDPMVHGPDLRLEAGATATYIDFGSLAMSVYVKCEYGIWRLSYVVANIGSGPRIEILPQEPYYSQEPRDIPEVKYSCTLLSRIVQDGGASIIDADAPAYDGGKMSSLKLSLRLQFPHITYAGTQFRVRFGKAGTVITRGRLALHIANEMHKLTEKAQKEGWTFPFEHLVLIGVIFPSKASCQPTIGIVAAGAAQPDILTVR